MKTNEFNNYKYYNFNCFEESRNLKDISTSVYECVRESLEEKYSDEYDSYDYQANLYE